MSIKSSQCTIGLSGLIFLLSLGITLVGCGRKAPPIPPRRLPLIAPIELKAKLSGNEVYLNWHCATDERGDYEVLRAAVEANRTGCSDCPLIFQKVGRATTDVSTKVVEYKDNVAHGFVYTYKVQRIGGAGDKGPASNAVVINLSR